jgi:hypothetical protein
MRKACLPRLRQRRAWAGMNACRTADRQRRRGARSHAQLLQLSATLDQGFQSACVLMALHRLASPAWLVQLAGKRALYLLSARARFLRGSLDGRYRLAVLFSYFAILSAGNASAILLASARGFSAILCP